ncbi:MAG: hypothetical protein QXV64_00925 [Candidatus Anstonellaceae archaeon]
MQHQKGFFYQNYLQAKILNTKAFVRLYGPNSSNFIKNLETTQKKKEPASNILEFSKKFLDTRGLFL